MADNAVVHIGENSPEEVAYKLLVMIGRAEGKGVGPGTNNPMDRAWILQTYAQCRTVVKTSWKASDILKEFPIAG